MVKVILIHPNILSIPKEYRYVNQLNMAFQIDKIVETKEEYLKALDESDTVFSVFYITTNKSIRLYTLHPNGLLTVGVDTNYKTDLLDVDPLSHYLYIDALDKVVDKGLNTVDYDKFTDEIKKEREERNKIIRTELDALNKILKDSEIDFNDVKGFTCNISEVTHIIQLYKLLKNIILDQYEYNPEYETKLSETKDLAYTIEYNSGHKIHRDCCEISVTLE